VPRARIALLVLGVALAGGSALAVQVLTSSAGAAVAALAVGTLAVGLATAQALQADRARIDELASAIQALADGQLERRLAPARLAELGPLALLVNRVAETVADSQARVDAHLHQVQRIADALAAAHTTMQQEADKQEASVEETASLHANINTSIRGINGEVENLARANEESASSILELGSAVEQVASSATALQQTVESSTSSLHEMGVNIRQVAHSSDSVQQMAEETAASISQMDRAIQEVGTHVRGASELTERVSESADEGSRAVGATIEGIARIRELTRESKAALEGLAERIGEIGNIATVIGGISDETNLLSLNAAIIAAQAGEHGRAFAVVADQVKTLARRTTVSTKEIERLIADVQARSAKAVEAMGAGIQAVEEGVVRSRVAGEALETIRHAARDASGRASEIARAAEEQARNSKHVADAAQRTSEHVQQISTAMAEQSRASDQLLKNASASVEMCRQMSHATDEQRASGRYITTNIEAITEMIRSIQQNTRQHERASASVAETFLLLLESTRSSGRRVPEIADAIARLRQSAEALHGEAASPAAKA
jgi:methyl-accepting chemotaxis protein